MKSGSLNFLKLSRSVQVCTGIALASTSRISNKHTVRVLRIYCHKTDASIITVWCTAGHEFTIPEIFPTRIVKKIQALCDVTLYRLVYNIGVSKD
jgi:hypothetical protein